MAKKFGGDKRVTASIILILVIAVLFAAAFVEISRSVRERSLGRMEEGVKTVTEEITNKFQRDGEILNAAAAIISQANNLDTEETGEIVKSVAPLLETMQIRVLTKDNQLITASGEVNDVGDASGLDFAVEGNTFQSASSIIGANIFCATLSRLFRTARRSPCSSESQSSTSSPTF